MHIFFGGFFATGNIVHQTKAKTKGVDKANKVPFGSNAVQMHEIQRFAQSARVNS